MFLDSKISMQDAKQFIDFYRKGLPVNAVKSIWIEKEIIDYIRNHPDPAISGVRVYLGKYDGLTGRSGSEPNNFPKGKKTAILAVTRDNGGAIHENIPDAFFDYGHPCPPCLGWRMIHGHKHYINLHCYSINLLLLFI